MYSCIIKEVIRPDCPPTGSQLDFVLLRHVLNRDALIGKTVLDLGCGHSDLQDELNLAGFTETTVIGLDADPDQFATARKTGGQTNYRLADIGKPLEIESGSIDIALATYSFPMWARTQEEITTFFAELRRVVKKPGGKISIYPMVVAMPMSPTEEQAREIEAMRRRTGQEALRFKLSPGWRTVHNEKSGLLQVIRH